MNIYGLSASKPALSAPSTTATITRIGTKWLSIIDFWTNNIWLIFGIIIWHFLLKKDIFAVT